MWIAKLGGSLLAGSEPLRPWLAALSGRPDLVLVPGGGPFADQVRAAQVRWGFDDATAHHLALLAMEQHGRMLCALQPGLAPAATPAALLGIASSGTTPVWMPVAMALADPTLPRDWDLTSDALAAWLGARLGAEALLLIKSAPLPGGRVPLETLALQGLVDTRLPAYARAAGVPVYLLSSTDLEALPGLLAHADHTRVTVGLY
ncbi:aspartate/glutamate/uridylate kinase [Thiocapsa rosea]|uniref:Aspartate/glutamate/uridylate kinase domain-containing protein n=1 Tax=Thiocapsa rosea TaxID=69360 RepID=A0A495VCI9_9GAMM|nr:aspartate/glutamate/uridylate kinase [Thiocapsa rosea]RKT47121.1 hypothetical protein BDD21_4676 [Thiocapsa rosea]